jgi:hypothetical protein
MLEFLRSIKDEPWKPLSRPATVAWLVFYAAFLVYTYSAHGGFLFIDNANLVIHEGGHNLFGWFGPTLGLWGGTLLQWLVPFLLAAYFYTQRQTAGFVFCLFFFFENWLYTATYMADARAQQLPLSHDGRSGFRRTRLPRNLLEPGRPRLRHEDRRGRPDHRLYGHVGVRGLVGMEAAEKPDSL